VLERRVNARLALGAALFLAVNPSFFRYGYSATNDALALALQSAALAALLLGTRPRTAALAGVLAALAFLTRYNALVLVPAGLLAISLGGTSQPARRRAALAFAAGFVAPVLPWVLFSFARGQSFQPQFHHNIAYDVFARARGIAWDDYQKLLQPQFRSLADVIARDPGAVLRRELFNVWDHLRLDIRNFVGGPVALCAAIGLALAWADGTLKRLWPVFLWAGLFFLSLVPVFYSERYSLPLLPAYAALAGAAFASPLLALPWGRTRGIWLKAGLAALPLVLSADRAARATRVALNQLPIEVLECARTLQQERQPGDRVIARKPHIAFHGGVQALAFPFTRTVPELAAYARRHGARWLFFSWPEAEMRPAYWFLLDTAAVVPGLTIRHATAPRPAVLYEIGPEFGQTPSWAANDTLRQWHVWRAQLRVDPLDPKALFGLAFIEYGRGEHVSAQRRLRLATRVAPTHLDGWMLLGETSLALEDAATAREAFERALRLQPGNVAARIGLGWASLLQRRPAEAAALWRPVVSLTRDPGTLGRMTELFAALGDREAEATARAALARLVGRR
jgi:tetratricopeptide (TPR) repeat protein